MNFVTIFARRTKTTGMSNFPMTLPIHGIAFTTE